MMVSGCSSALGGMWSISWGGCSDLQLATCILLLDIFVLFSKTRRILDDPAYIPIVMSTCSSSANTGGSLLDGLFHTGLLPQSEIACPSCISTYSIMKPFLILCYSDLAFSLPNNHYSILPSSPLIYFF